MAERSIEDRLREEYFDLLPDIRRVAENVETEVRHCLLPILRNLDDHEQVNVTSRIKACDSALDALSRRQEGNAFDRDRPELYTLTSLNDLAGIRVLAFPRSRLAEIDEKLRKRFPDWVSDPVPGIDETAEPLAFKYSGFCDVSSKIRGELQIVSMLIGLFWEIEHSAIYKPTPRLKRTVNSPRVQERVYDVYGALRSFEDVFETSVRGT